MLTLLLSTPVSEIQLGQLNISDPTQVEPELIKLGIHSLYQPVIFQFVVRTRPNRSQTGQNSASVDAVSSLI